MAGSFVLDPRSGSISSITADQNEGGTAAGIFWTGSISSVSRSDGRAPVSFTAGGPHGTASNSVFYIVNPDEIFILGTDSWGPALANKAPRRGNQRLAQMGIAFVLLFALLSMPSCAGSSGGGGVGTPAGNYTLTITGKSASGLNSTTVALTVN